LLARIGQLSPPLPSYLKADIGVREASGAQITPSLETGQISVPNVLDTLYPEPEPLEKPLTNAERDAIIRGQYDAGVSQAELARQFGISYQRVHQILRGE
jgi:hypothetical protein